MTDRMPSPAANQNKTTRGTVLTALRGRLPEDRVQTKPDALKLQIGSLEVQGSYG